MRQKPTIGEDGDGDEKTQITGITPWATGAPQARSATSDPRPDPRLSALRSLSLDKDRKAVRAATPRARVPSWVPWVLLGLVVGGVVITQLVARRSTTTAATTAANAPATGIVTPTGAGQPLHAAGYIAARTPIVVGSVAPGRVKALLVAEGDVVKKNQVVAQLDDGRPQAEMALARARLRDAERILGRTQMLRKVEGATAADLDHAVGQVEIARAALEPIAQQIEDAKIRSPIDGTILEELVHQGAIVVGNANVFKIADLTRLAAEIDVNEADLAQVHMNQKADIVSDAFADKSFPGIVHDIGEQADRSKGTVVVKVYLEVPENTLRPGMSVKVAFEAADGKPRILIPKSAVDSSGNVSIVGPDGKTSTRHVTTRSAGPDQAEIVDGLTGGERIVLAHP